MKFEYKEVYKTYTMVCRWVDFSNNLGYMVSKVKHICCLLSSSIRIRYLSMSSDLCIVHFSIYNLNSNIVNKNNKDYVTVQKLLEINNN